MRKLLFQSLFRPTLHRAGAVAGRRRAGRTRRLGRPARARRRLGRSLSIREVDAGSCNGCELEIHALNNAYYDVERFGLRFVASPRHADVLMVTGPVTKNMREALERTYQATPDPKWVVAIGDCAQRWRLFRRQLRGGRRRRRGHPGRSPHSRLPADADGDAAGPCWRCWSGWTALSWGLTLFRSWLIPGATLAVAASG